MENTELMVTGNQSLYVSPVVGLEEAKAKFETVRQYTANCLTKEIDYGKVPGVSKPSLLKPGAEKICSLFGLTPKFTCVDKIMNWTGEGNPDNEPFFYFEYRCDLYRGGEFVASCDASCNSWEKKYRYRKGELVCPNCGKPLRKSKNSDGYYCWVKQGGCGATFASTDGLITSQRVGEVKNMDSAEQVNTFQKMAQKRAYVGATLIACNLSEYYTQDVEDMYGGSFSHEPEVIEAEYTPVKHNQKTVEEAQKPKRKVFDADEFLKNFSRPAGVKDMSLRNAETFSASDGTLYKDMAVKDLYGHWCGLSKRIKTETPEQAELTAMAISAICAILYDKKLKNIPEPNGGRPDPFVKGQ